MNMLDNLLQNPAFLILALVVTLVIIGTNTVFAASVMRGSKDKIEEALNRDKNAMDELHQRVEALKGSEEKK